jgi:hypothetical protein
MLNHLHSETSCMNTGSARDGNINTLLIPRIGVPKELTPLDDYVSIYHKYIEYKKVTNIATLAARGLPVLQGFVTRTINEEVSRYLEFWMRVRGMQRLTLLFDSTQTVDLKGLMAATPALEEFQHMGYLLHDTVVAIIMEEHDQFQQSYSVLTSFSEDHIMCEIVGPGFEVNDLTRGNISPHERLLFRRKGRNDDNYRDLGQGDLIAHFVTKQEAYRQSVKLRYSKIHNMTCKRPGEAVQISPLTQEQIRDVEAFLAQRGSTLLNHRDNYIPINYEKLRELYGYISELDVFFSDEVRGKVVAASFLKKHGLVFWGIFGSDQFKMPTRHGLIENTMGAIRSV